MENEKKKILFIEDDTFLLGLAATKLEKEGFEVRTAETGQQGITIMDMEKVDMLLLDLMLPDISGFEILDSIKQQDTKKDMPVIIFSNLSEDENIKKGLELGAIDYMVKSNFTLEELVEKIKKTLNV
jgi:DNA-binding response OmpR family regulator